MVFDPVELVTDRRSTHDVEPRNPTSLWFLDYSALSACGPLASTYQASTHVRHALPSGS